MLSVGLWLLVNIRWYRPFSLLLFFSQMSMVIMNWKPRGMLVCSLRTKGKTQLHFILSTKESDLAFMFSGRQWSNGPNGLDIVAPSWTKEETTNKNRHSQLWWQRHSTRNVANINWGSFSFLNRHEILLSHYQMWLNKLSPARKPHHDQWHGPKCCLLPQS